MVGVPWAFPISKTHGPMHRTVACWKEPTYTTSPARRLLWRPSSGTQSPSTTAKMSNFPPFSIFVLGAGFSRRAGLPLASELWREVRRRADSTSGRAGQFRDDLNAYVAFRKECDGKEITGSQVDFEDFMAFLDVEHYLGLRGSDTWSGDGNESQVVVKTLIGEILTELMPREDSIPELYKQFARTLQPGDFVLTFNYDVLLERALDAVGKRYRLFPQRFKVVHPGYSPWAEVDSSQEEVVVLKLHGSIDWFDRQQYSALEKDRRETFRLDGAVHPVFKTTEALRVVPLLDGPRFSHDPLREMYRVLDIERLYAKDILFRATPSLLNPSSAKILYSQKLRDFWWGMGDVGVLNFRMAIIGFSLSSHDDYARQVLYRLVANYQRRYWEAEGLPGDRKKTPLLIVDHCDSPGQEEDFRRRYSFVDWSRAEIHFAGFDEGVVRRINDFC